jgi:hypothetical protein
LRLVGSGGISRFRSVRRGCFIRSWGGLIGSWSRFVRSGFVRAGMVFLLVLNSVVFAYLSFIFHVRMILLILIYVVVDDLGSAVGKLDLILSLDSIAVSYFGLGVNVRVTVFIIFLDSIAIFIVVRFFFFMVGSRMMRSRFISRSGVIRSRMIRGWGIWWRGTITAN